MNASPYICHSFFLSAAFFVFILLLFILAVCLYVQYVRVVTVMPYILQCSINIKVHFETKKIVTHEGNKELTCEA